MAWRGPCCADIFAVDLSGENMKRLLSKGLFWLCILTLGIGGGNALAQNFSLSTNVAQIMMLGTANIRGGYPASRHISVEAGAAYNPFTFGKEQKQKYFRRVEFFAGGRYWPWFVNSGWFVSAYADWAKYAFGGIFTKKAYEGYAYGVKLGGGYALMLDKGVNLEMGMGAFLGMDNHTGYNCTKCGSSLGKKERFVAVPSVLVLGVTLVF